MTVEEGIYIVGAGSRTPVGIDFSMTATSVNAGYSGLNEFPDYFDGEGEPISAARAEFLEENTRGIERMADLAVPAIIEACRFLPSKFPVPRISLFLGLSRRYAELFPSFSTEISERLQKRWNEKNPNTDLSIHCFSLGNAAGFQALKEGRLALENKESRLCLVGGVDSFFSDFILDALEEEKGFYSSENPWGIFPGEAAGFNLIATLQAVREYKLPILARILSVETAFEKNHFGTGEICLGKGLSDAIGRAVKALPAPDRKIDGMLCDRNADRQRADESGFALSRVGKFFARPQESVAPANLWGEVGAANAPLLINHAVASGLFGFSNGPLALAWAASDEGERGAALIELEPRFPHEIS